MTTGEQKFIIWLSLMLLTWRVIELPAVQNAFLQFLAVGQVPGTDMILSPKGVFLVLATLFSLSLVAIFWSNLKRSFTRHQVKRANQPVRRTDQPVVLSKSRPSAAMHIPSPKLELKDKKLPMLYVPSIRPFLQKASLFMRKAGIIARKAAAAEYDSLKTIFTFIWKVMLFVSMAVWRFAEPRLRTFDKWLERKLHKNRITSEILEIIQECWRTVTSDRSKNDDSEKVGGSASPTRSI